MKLKRGEYIHFEGELEEFVDMALERLEAQGRSTNEQEEIRQAGLEAILIRLIEHVAPTQQAQIDIVDPYNGWEVDD